MTQTFHDTSIISKYNHIMKKSFLNFGTPRPASKASWLLTLMAVVLGLGLAACDPDPEPEPEPDPTPTVSIQVSPSSLSLAGTKGASATFTIKTDAEWIIRCDEDWLKFSGKSGVGTTTITVTTNSANEDLDDRVTVVTITDVDRQALANLEISQETAVILGCRVTVNDPLYLTDSMAATFGVTSTVGYFYFGCYTGSINMFDDAEIIRSLPEDGQKVELPYNDVWTLTELEEDETYTINMLAFDKQGNRGELTRVEFTAPVMKNSDGWTLMGNGSYDSNYWYWSTSPEPQTSQYYMIASEGDNAVEDLLYTSPAQLAYRLRDKIRNETATPMVRAGDWRMGRTAGAWAQMAATWSADAKGNLAPMMNYFAQVDTEITGRPSRTSKALANMKAKTGKPNFHMSTPAENAAINRMRVSWK